MQYSHSFEHVFLHMRSSLESTILIWNMQYHTVQCSFRTTSFRTVPHKGAEFLAKYAIYCAAFLWDSIIYIYMYKETVFLQNLQYSFQVLSIAWKQNQMQYSLHKKVSFNVSSLNLIVRNPWKSAFPQPPALFPFPAFTNTGTALWPSREWHRFRLRIPEVCPRVGLRGRKSGVMMLAARNWTSWKDSDGGVIPRPCNDGPPT